MPWNYYNRAGKYNAKRTTVDGITFASKKEALRYTWLKRAEKNGKIKDLQTQVPFTVCPSFVIGEEVFRPIVYKPDFVYFRSSDGAQIIEDVKGFKTKEYLIKKKLFLCQYVAGKDNVIFLET